MVTWRPAKRQDEARLTRLAGAAQSPQPRRDGRGNHALREQGGNDHRGGERHRSRDRPDHGARGGHGDRHRQSPGTPGRGRAGAAQGGGSWRQGRGPARRCSGRRRRRPGRGRGGERARPDRHSGQRGGRQHRHRQSAGDNRAAGLRRLAEADRLQPRRHLSLHPRRDPGDEAPAQRQDRQSGLDRRARPQHQQLECLCRGQGRHHRIHPQAGLRTRSGRHQRQRHCPQRDADRTYPAALGEALAGGAGRGDRAHAAAPRGRGGRPGQRHLFPRIVRCRFRHRPHHRRDRWRRSVCSRRRDWPARLDSSVSAPWAGRWRSIS